jgi:sodium transport system permease protein
LYFPPDFRRRLESFCEAVHKGNVGLEVPRPVFLYTTANERSQLAFAALLDVWQRWNNQFRRMNLAAVRLPEAIAAPIEPETIDVAEESGRGGAAVWSRVMPVLLLIWALTGAFYPAVDLCAGEKERGTLETLLCSPARRSEIVLGKLLTIMLFSSITAALNVLSMGLMGWVVLSRLPGFGPPPLGGALWLAVALVPISALFSALCLAIAAFARSTKEGQYYLMPLLLATMPLAILPVASGIELTLGTSLIPVTGVALLLRVAIEGNVWHALEYLVPVMTVTLAGCLMAIRWAIDQFNSESVLFRESERLEPGLWLRHLVRDRQSTPTLAIALFGGITILLIEFFLSFCVPPLAGLRQVILVAAVTQLAVIAAPSLLMTVALTRSPRQTLLLRWPAWMTVPAAVALAVVLSPVVDAVKTGVLRLYPMTTAVKEEVERLNEAVGEATFWQVALFFALMPAVCEELAFRGFLLSGLRQRGTKWRPIIASALFFGLSHPIMQQSLVTMMVGVVLGLLAVQTRSILPGMVFHLTHNLVTIFSPDLAQLDPQQWPMLPYLVRLGGGEGPLFRWPVVLAGALVGLAILGWFHRLPLSVPVERRNHPGVSLNV